MFGAVSEGAEGCESSSVTSAHVVTSVLLLFGCIDVISKFCNAPALRARIASCELLNDSEETHVQSNATQHRRQRHTRYRICCDSDRCIGSDTPAAAGSRRDHGLEHQAHRR